MKKFICCALAAISSYCTIAQPVITAADVTPVIGETISYNTDISLEAVYFSGPGPAGAGVTWDFHTMPALGGTSITTYMACSTTPFCDSFPGSDLAGYSILASPTWADTSYGYSTTSAIYNTSLGYCDHNGSQFNYYKDHFVRMPIIYGDQYMDSGFLKHCANCPDEFDATDTLTVDGYGTLILPGGTVNNVLRVRMATDTANTHYQEFYWFSADYHNLLMYMAIQYSFGTDIVVYNNFAYRSALTPTGVRNANNAPDLKVSPNPASDNVNLSFNLADADNSSITICDVTGTVVDKKYSLVQGANNISINTSSLPAGIYLLHLQTATGTATQKLTVIH
jgi:hypothetical protein